MSKLSAAMQCCNIVLQLWFSEVSFYCQRGSRLLVEIREERENVSYTELVKQGTAWPHVSAASQ